jgi:hypothetical protein
VKVLTKLIALALSLVLVGCYIGDPIPVECVCQCEQPKVAVVPRIPNLPRRSPKKGADRAKKIAAKKAAAARGANALGKRVTDAAKRAEGRIARQPGSGDVVKTDDRTQKAMMQTYTAFLKGASKRDLAVLKPYLTERLHGSLVKNLPKYEERFFRGLEDSINALGKGGMTVKETRDMGRGNVEALVVFGNGHERRAIFFKEGGAWKLNRL